MIEGLGTYAIGWGAGALSLWVLFVESILAFFRQIFSFRFRFRETIEQMYAVGVQSVPVIAFSLTFTSLMLVLELSFNLKLVLRQNSLVPAFSTVLMLRELGPVLTALLLTSRVGAGIAAEIGTMRVTEQLDALRVLAIDPVEYLTLPRLIACVFAATSLAVISVAIAILGGMSVASVGLGSSAGQYANTIFVFTHFADFRGCLVKAAVFGAIIPIVASHHGFRCKMGSEGVGNAATSAVVHSSILIIAADFVLTYLLYAV